MDEENSPHALEHFPNRTTVHLMMLLLQTTCSSSSWYLLLVICVVVAVAVPAAAVASIFFHAVSKEITSAGRFSSLQESNSLEVQETE